MLALPSPFQIGNVHSELVCVRVRSMNIGGVEFPLEEQSRDADRVVYHGRYDTEGVPHTKSGDRQPVQVSIQVSARPTP